MNKNKAIKLEVGKSYKIVTRHGRYSDPLRMHVDAIIENKVTPNIKDSRLIVYRIWKKHKKRWHWDVQMFWEIAIMNDWEYNLDQ